MTQPSEPPTELLLAGRITHVRDICRSSIDQDRGKPGTLTDRAWLAQSVLNILDGNIDRQIAEEFNRD